MNVILWAIQGILALHTLMGAGWKLANSEIAVPSLSAIPHSAWVGMAIVEVLCAVALIVPAFRSSLGGLALVAAITIAVEMLIFCGVHLRSGDPSVGPMVYWLIVAAVCAFVVYGRLRLAPV